MAVLLSRRAVVQVAMESAYNVAASVGLNDGVLVASPMYMGEPNMLERNFTRDTLSPIAHIIGRMLSKMEFETELRGNGKQNTGLSADAPIISRLFRACGYKLYPSQDPSILGPYDINVHANAVAWAASSGTKATGLLSFTGNVTAGDTVTINGIVYTYVVTPALPYDVQVGGSEAASITNLMNAINAGTGVGVTYGANTLAHPDVSATSTSTTLTATARVANRDGNLITTTELGSSTSWGGATLSGGTAMAVNTDAICYYLDVDTAGASGAAKITVTSDTAGEGNSSATVTSGSAFTVGTHGLTITPTFTGSLALHQRWTVWCMPAGMLLRPVSDNFESCTIVMYKDKVKHVMPGAFGTFTIDAKAGDYAKIKWTFTGTYQQPVDGTLPAPVYEKTLPSQVELARLRLDQFNAIVDKMTFNQANDIQIRPDVSSSQGYVGTRIVSRKPEGGIDPEADTVASYDFWTHLRNADRVPFQMRIGTVLGNTVWMLAPSVQYTKMTYADRNGIMNYDAGLKFSGYQADDESMFYFM